MTGGATGKPNETHLGYVYLIHNPKSGFYKIGSARRPLTRLAQLSRELRAPCVLLHTIATNHAARLEKAVQLRFAFALVASETFDLTSTDIEAIQSVSTVWFMGEGLWQPQSRLRSEFDGGSKWAKGLAVCGPA